MANIITSPVAASEGTFIIVATITDEEGDALSPATLTWTLTDMLGNVINTREDVSIAVPASVNPIVLQGDDLAIQDDDNTTENRLLTIEGTYDSSYGSGLPLREEVRFTVQNLVVEVP